MKPTTDSIQAAFDLAAQLDINAHTAMLQLASAKVAFQCGSPKTAVDFLAAARAHLDNIRRTQTAILAHIDSALESAKA